MRKSHSRLRVAFVAGTLGQGGAEKQLVYMVSALKALKADVRVYSLNKGEFYDHILRRLGIMPIWIGQFDSPIARLVALTYHLKRFHPSVVQSAHFFTNLYVTIASRFIGTFAIGSIRNDTHHELQMNGRWGRWLLHLPSVLLANSHLAAENAQGLGVHPSSMYVLPNVIDLGEFDSRLLGATSATYSLTSNKVVAVGRLVPAKRFDRFLTALALARKETGDVTGIIVGDGPERLRLESMAKDLELVPDGVQFLGRRNDVPELLHQAATFVLTSNHEGFPNVILEAMAARLPVITTPAGDAGIVVQDGVTGFVVPFDDVQGIAKRIVQVLRSLTLQKQFGAAGRRRVEQCYSFDSLPEQLLSTYRAMGMRSRDISLLDALGR